MRGRPKIGTLAIVCFMGIVVLPAGLGCRGSSPTATTVATTAGTAAGTTTTTPPGEEPTVTTNPTAGGPAAAEADLAVDVVATGLEVPWEMRFLPDGDLLVTERPGRLSLIDVATGEVTIVGTIAVAAAGEGGLMGLALDPDYPRAPYIYVAYTYAAGGDLANRVSRLTFSGTAISDEKILLDGTPGAGNHDGSRVAFGPDGYLYVTTGDAGQSGLAQQRESQAGKVLRLDKNGGPAPGNPFPSSPVYTYGHRNPQGLAWNPATGQPFVTEHGPSDNDEVNRLTAGGNYGWPEVRGTGGGAGFVDPIATWTPTIAPAGAVFVTGPQIPGWAGSFVFVTLKESDLRRLVPADPAFDVVADEEVLFDGRFGRLRAIAEGPDGYLYVGTSNRDGRGSPTADDDRILRIRPTTAQ